jgi:hypothetical protein
VAPTLCLNLPSRITQCQGASVGKRIDTLHSMLCFLRSVWTLSYVQCHWHNMDKFVLIRHHHGFMDRIGVCGGQIYWAVLYRANLFGRVRVEQSCQCYETVCIPPTRYEYDTSLDGDFEPKRERKLNWSISRVYISVRVVWNCDLWMVRFEQTIYTGSSRNQICMAHHTSPWLDCRTLGKVFV